MLLLQGKRKDLPTFTKGSEGLETGAIRDADYLIELEGYSSFQSESDFHSSLDRNGIRWLNSTQGSTYFANNNFTVKIQAKIVKKYNLKDRFSIFNTISNLDGQGKAQFVKYYMDEAKKLMTKKFMKGLIEDQQNVNNGVYNNNEVLLHNFKVKSIKVIGNMPTPAISKYLKDTFGFTPDSNIKRKEIRKLNITQ